MIAANREIARLASKPKLSRAEAIRLKWLQRLKARRDRIRVAFPKEFDDGARRAFTRNKSYPPWFAGVNVGLSDRVHATLEETVDG